MALSDNFFDPNDIIGNGMDNGAPAYETFIPYVELYCVRYNETSILVNQNGTTINAPLTSEVINFLGFDTSTGYYSTRYSDELTGESNRENVDEGFGIVDIFYDMKSRFVPTVEITFMDIKGSSLLNPQQRKTSNYSTTGSKYAVLFDFPPPTFVLILKGAFGKATKMVLHMLKHDITYDSTSGNFIIKAKFVGKTFAPLSDIKIGWIKAAPYIDSNLSVNGDITKNIEHLFELKVIGDQLYDKLNQLVTSSTEQQEIEDINDNQSVLIDLTNNIADIDADSSLTKFTIIDNSFIINGIPFIIQNGTPTKIGNVRLTNLNRKFIMYRIPSNNTNLIKETFDKIDKHRTALFTADYQKLTNIKNNPIKLYQLFGVNATDQDDFNQVVLYFDYTDYLDSIITKRNALQIEKQAARISITKKADDIVIENMGFLPTVKKITEILCTDIDIFFNKIKDAGDYGRTDAITNNQKGVNVLDNGGFPRVTTFQNVNNVTTEVAVYPGSDDILLIRPDFADWKEVKFVEKFIAAYFQQKVFEEELEEIKKTNEDGTSKIVPISPLDTDKFSDTKTLSYVGKNDLDSFLTNVFKRYFIGTQYTYKGFWGTTYSETKRLELVNYIVSSEVQNIVSTPYDDKTINGIITFFDKIIQTEGNLANLDTYFRRNSQQYPKLNEFLRTLNGSDLNSYQLNTTNVVYSLKDNDDYKGIYPYIDFNPTSDIINTSLVTDDQKPTKYLIDFVNGTFLNGLFKEDGEKPEITTENLLFFKDALNSENKFQSDFLSLSYKKVTRLFNTDDFSEFIFTVTNEDKQYPSIIDNVQTLENILDPLIYSINDITVDGKFLYPAIIQAPTIFLYKVGKDTKNGNKYNLSPADQQYFIKFYDDFLLKAPELIKSYNDIFGSINPTLENFKLSVFVTYLLTENIFMNSTSFTFLDEDDVDAIKDIKEDKFYPLFQKQPNGVYTEDGVPFDQNIWGSTNEKNRMDVFLTTMKGQIIPALKNKLDLKAKKKKELNKTLRDSDLKTQLYYSFKLIYDRWIKGTESFANKDYAYPYSNNTPLIDKFKFVDRSYNNIGDVSIVDYSNILDYLDNPDGEVYGCLSAFLAKNNFDFFPLPNFIDFKGDPQSWKEIFNPRQTAQIDTQPMFTCMYIGGFSSQQDDVVSTKALNQPQDMTDNIFGFNINFGIQNQSIFRDIDLSTSEFKETGESLKLMDDIFKATATKTPTPKGQNLFEIYENRSYTCKVSVPFGNMLIQPTQYFELFNIPLFNGLYIILEVSHKMNSSSNRLETTFMGSRIKRYVSPLVTKPIADVLGVYGELSKIGTSLEQNETITDLGGVTQTVTILPTDFLVRKDDKISNLIVRSSNGTFINDPRYLQFTQQTIDTSKLGTNTIVKK